MAIDQTLVAIDIAGTAVTKVGAFIDVLEALDSELAHGMAAGLNLADYDVEFAASDSLKHVDGATLNKVLAIVVVGVLDYLNATMMGEDTYMEILQRARR